MNVQEAHIAFRVLLDKGGSLAYPDFDDEEIDLFINKATMRVIKSKLTGKSTNPLRKDSVEETEKRINDLRLLTEDARITPLVHDFNKNKPHGNFIPMPDHFLYLLDEVVNIRDIDCNGLVTTYEDVEIKKTTHDKYNKMIKDPFNKPTLLRVLKLPFGYYNYDVTETFTCNELLNFEGIDPDESIGLVVGTPDLPIGFIMVNDTITINNNDYTVVRVIPTVDEDFISGISIDPFFIDDGTALAHATKIVRVTNTTSEVEEIITHSDILQLKMRYIRHPRALDYTLYDPTDPNKKVIDSPAGSFNANYIELTEQVCDEIIDEAVTIALEVIESKRYQSSSYENNKVS
jgi:hypothetical protein